MTDSAALQGLRARVEAMRQVSKEEFFKPIYDGKLDVHPSIQNYKWPYWCLWTFHRKFARSVYGKTVDHAECGLTKTDYFLAIEERIAP